MSRRLIIVFNLRNSQTNVQYIRRIYDNVEYFLRLTDFLQIIQEAASFYYQLIILPPFDISCVLLNNYYYLACLPSSVEEHAAPAILGAFHVLQCLTQFLLYSFTMSYWSIIIFIRLFLFCFSIYKTVRSTRKNHVSLRMYIKYFNS